MRKIFLVLLLMPFLGRGGDLEFAALTNHVLPAVRSFMATNQLLMPIPFGTNAVKSFMVDLEGNRDSVIAHLRLTNNYIFSFSRTGGVQAVKGFIDDNENWLKLTDPSPKNLPLIQKALSQTDVVGPTNALALAFHYFKLNGHDPKNFHPEEFARVKGGYEKPYLLPYYSACWWRKDVTMAQREQGLAVLARVEIYISGVNSNLVGYDRLFMPLDRDK